jgi:hypothetical protein
MYILKLKKTIKEYCIYGRYYFNYPLLDLLAEFLEDFKKILTLRMERPKNFLIIFLRILQIIVCLVTLLVLRKKWEIFAFISI